MRKLTAVIIFLIFASTSAIAGKAKTSEATPEVKKVCRESTTIIDMMAEARDKGKTLKDARDQRIGYPEMKKMFASTGKQATEDELNEATESMIDVVFIKMARYSRRMLVSEYFDWCIKEMDKP